MSVIRASKSAATCSRAARRTISSSGHLSQVRQVDRPQPSKVKEPLNINFAVAQAKSNEQRAFFASEVDEQVDLDWGTVDSKGTTGRLENGRVVECRRSGQVSIGLVVASVLAGDRPRLLLLRSTGEIWPISSHDVQFVMPASLIPSSLTEACWSPELLENWVNAENDADSPVDPTLHSTEMLDARRKVAVVLRRIQRETEKMCGQLRGGTVRSGRIGGAEGVWEKWASESEASRTGVTAVEAAEYILYPQRFTKAEGGEIEPSSVKPNTLPAYAAHVLLMARPDLFVGDSGDMWATGKFTVRSRPERVRYERLQSWVKDLAHLEGEANPLQSFVTKARHIIDMSQKLKADTSSQTLQKSTENLPAWSESDLDIIHSLFGIVCETRSTQTSPYHSLSISIARLVIPNPEGVVDRGFVSQLLQDLGMILPWDSLETARTVEAAKIAMASAPRSGTARSSEDLLEGNELNDLREDYTSHTVHVIDDATASELDDGIALERIPGSDDVWVHVHVADPTRFLPPSHPLAKQASFQGSALYLPEGNRPLFTLEVVMKELSLGAQVSRDEGRQGVLTFSARMSPKGSMEDMKVKLGWIKKPHVTTYASVNKALGITSYPAYRPFGAPIPMVSEQKTMPEIAPSNLQDLQTLFDLAKKIRANRYSTAGFEWSFPKASVSLIDHAAQPNANAFSREGLSKTPQIYSGRLQVNYSVSAGLSSSLDAGTMVAEYMVLAGRLAAQFCGSHNIPVIYRGSFAPKPVATSKTIEGLLAHRDVGTGWTDPYTQLEPGWYRPPAYVSLSPVQHWIMGIDKPGDGYLRATSPLRRFDDMLVHWQIKAALARERGLGGEMAKGFTKEEVVTLAQRSDEGSRRAKRAGINAEQFWMATVVDHHSKMPGGSILPKDWQINEKEAVNVQGEMVGRVAGRTEGSVGKELTVIRVDSLGVQAKMEHSNGKTWKMGEEVRVKLHSVARWPRPFLLFELIE